MPKLIWIGHRGSDADIFNSLLPLRAVICCDWDARLSSLSDEVFVSSIEKTSRRRLNWSSASLGEIDHEGLRSALRHTSGNGIVAVVPYRAMQAIEDAVSSFPQACLAAARADIVENLDDKEVQRKLFDKLGLPTPNWTIVESDRFAKNALLGKIGYPAVAQTLRGSLGIGTFLVESPEEIQALNAGAGGKLLVSEYLPGPVVNATAVVGRNDVYLGWPSVQMVGLPICAGSGYPFHYCGNDFGATSFLPNKSIDSLFSFIRILANGLRTLGFLGIFGTDWIFNDGRWYILELNPRFQGSSLCLTNLEREAGVVPLAVEHLRAFLPESALFETRNRPPLPEPLMGGQVVLYQRHDNWVKVGNSIIGYLEKSNANSQRWNIVGAPTVGTEVTPGAVVARLCIPESILDLSFDKLTPNAMEAVRMLYNFLGIGLGNEYNEVIMEREQ